MLLLLLWMLATANISYPPDSPGEKLSPDAIDKYVNYLVPDTSILDFAMWKEGASTLLLKPYSPIL